MMTNDSYSLNFTTINMIPGFLTVIGEILTNARDVMYKNKGIDVKFNIDDNGLFVVETIGKGIPTTKQIVMINNTE